MIKVDGIPIEIVKPPDLDLAFETKIREITNEKNRPWFNTFMHPSANYLTDSLLEFERDAIPGIMEFTTRNGKMGCGCISENQ
ncbi:MAG: hypothetical protein QXP38_13040 [Nitrososphaerota archaeon]